MARLEQNRFGKNMFVGSNAEAAEELLSVSVTKTIMGVFRMRRSDMQLASFLEGARISPSVLQPASTSEA